MDNPLATRTERDHASHTRHTFLADTNAIYELRRRAPPTVVPVDIGASGIIFGFVVAMWAAYVLPLVLRRYDEAERKLPISGSFPRVIYRPQPKAETEVGPETPAETMGPEPQPHVAHSEIANPKPASGIDRPAARKAARRRRLVLYAVSCTALTIAAAAAVGYLPMWTIGIGAALVGGWLLTCRFQVRVERSLTRAKSERAELAEVLADVEHTVVISGQWEDHDPDARHVMEHAELETTALDEQLQIAVPSAASTGVVLWDPLPVTLPTYVTKPRAGRTVRTIDFDQPGTWTSGHVEGEQTELPGQAAAEDEGHPEAVGH